ncbi:hypothetical protein [Bordetella sp. BOR01]|uniref:hypothetical protein n=1 Tax=Bordetella sp. BOR01 TaxID=2854779 RepID=UPI001C47FC7F|nr:hypothetical protein [Bordetella sp. BOR01]MBV7482483.1 hypothetical protein [Bordetella sp. BOR01]
MKLTTFEDWRDTGLWAAIALAALISGFALGWSWRERPGALADVSLLSVLTALGTVGAAAGAVGIAYWQHRSATNERYVRATHAAAGSYLAMATMAGELNRQMPLIQAAGQAGTSMEAFDRIRTTIESIRGTYTLPDPVLLSPLGKNCGPRLASAIGQLGVLIKLLDVSRPYFEPGNTEFQDRQQDFGIILGMLHAVVQHLRYVSLQCQQVALPLDSPYADA